MFKQAQSQNLASNDYGLDNKRSEMAEQEVLARLESATDRNWDGGYGWTMVDTDGGYGWWVRDGGYGWWVRDGG